MGRLHSYRSAATVLIRTAENWPNLLADFTVSYIPSSEPMVSPLIGTPTVKSMEDAIMHMSSEGDILLHEAPLEKWKTLGLDDAISHSLYRDSFQPIVHCEILMHADLLERDLTHPSNFFNGFKFIGASKPTCRYCSYYFSEHPDNMKVRSSHGNSYPKWRLPDIFEDQDSTATSQRSRLIEKIATLASQDVLTLLRERVFQGKKYDTNTHSDLPKGMEGISEGSSSTSSVEDIQTEPGSDEDATRLAKHSSLSRGSKQTSDDSSELDDECDDDSEGGTLL